MSPLTSVLKTLFVASFIHRTLGQDDRPPSGSVAITSTQALGDRESTFGILELNPADKPYEVCPQNSVATTLAADNSFMTLIFDTFNVKIGNGAPGKNRRSICNVEMSIEAPAGWQYCAETADYRGYCRLDSGVNATISAEYDFGRGETVRYLEYYT
jgi:hypothetical protein